MAKAKLNWFVESLRGKVADCDKELTGHGLRKNLDGSISTVNYSERNFTTHPYSANELAHQEKFRQATAATKTVYQTPAQLATYVTAFKEQTKYLTLRGYIFSEEYKKLT